MSFVSPENKRSKSDWRGRGRAPLVAEPSVSSGEAGDLSNLTRIDVGADHWVIELTAAEAVEQVAGEWDDLVANAARANVFFERWQFEKAWSTFVDARGIPPVTIAMVFRRAQASQFAPTPIGLFPCVVDSDLGAFAGPTVSFWQHDYCFDPTPLLREGDTVAAVHAFLQWVAIRFRNCDLIRLHNVAGNGPFLDAVNECQALEKRHRFDFTTTNRAALRPHNSAEEYIAASVSASTRRELRRQSRRLAEVGVVETVMTASAEDAADWAERFLQLEQHGWKSETAINANLAHADYFRALVVEAAQRRQFEGLELTVDGRPVAMKCNLFSCESLCGRDRVAYAFKITYDETFKKFSPGVLLELRNIERFHDQGVAGWMDSCARFDHPMIDRLWSGRTPRSDIVLSNGGLRASIKIAGMEVARWLRRTWHQRTSRRQSRSVISRNF